jgi:hypothetical protein
VSRRWTLATEHLTNDDEKQPTRFQLCQKRMAHGRTAVEVRRSDKGAFFAGYQTCGSVWLCPVCSAKVRQGRADELDQAARTHVGLAPVCGPLRPGEARCWAQVEWLPVGGLEFVTLTLRHSRADRLSDTLDAVAKGWQHIQRHSRWRALRKRLGHGFVRAVEITVTREGGWHPHLHVMLFTERPWSADERADAEGVLWALWSAWCDKLDPDTHRHRPTRKRGLVWEPVKVSGAAFTARYLTKLAEGGREWGPAQELARGDLKSGRPDDAGKRSRSPFEVGLSAADGGNARDLALWREYEDATHGRRVLTWSRGLRDRLLADVPELDDEQLAQVDDVGEIVGYLLRDDERALRRTGLQLAMLQAVERDGVDGFWHVLILARRQHERIMRPPRMDELRRW